MRTSPEGQPTRRVTVCLNPSEFERLERFCKERGHKKSTLIAHLIRLHLDDEHFEKQQMMFAAPEGR